MEHIVDGNGKRYQASAINPDLEKYQALCKGTVETSFSKKMPEGDLPTVVDPVRVCGTLIPQLL